MNPPDGRLPAGSLNLMVQTSSVPDFLQMHHEFVANIFTVP
jgi:hypothetical protein